MYYCRSAIICNRLLVCENKPCEVEKRKEALKKNLMQIKMPITTASIVQTI